MVSDTIIFSLIDPLIAAIHRLNVRPACFPSALVCLATTHKLLVVLSSIQVDEKAMNAKKREWAKLVGELWRALPKKWGSLGSTVPGSFLQLYLTQAELGIVAIPNQQEVKDALSVAARFGVGIIKSLMTMVGSLFA